LHGESIELIFFHAKHGWQPVSRMLEFADDKSFHVRNKLQPGVL
jgi:hypothetical protein